LTPSARCDLYHFQEVKMSAVPSFLLKKLYLKGSLRNTERGFEFRIKNTLAPGTIVGLASLRVDGREVPLEVVTVAWEGGEARAAEVSPESPLSFGLNVEATLRVEGEQLPAGAHQISLTVVTKEVGKLTIPIADSV